MNFTDLTNSDFRHLEIIASRVEEAHIDLTREYSDWINCCFACASVGEQGRECFHILSRQNPHYDAAECDEKFTHCLRSSRGMVSIATVVEMAKRQGVDVSRPKGRPRKGETTAERRAKEKENLMEKLRQALLLYGEFRHNTWTKRVEVKEVGQDKWRVLDDRDLDTYWCRIRREGIQATKKLVESMLNNRDFSTDFNPVDHYLNSLTAWQEGDKDYIDEFFMDHLIFGDPEHRDFYRMVFRKWFVCNVALWKGLVDENPIMPVLCGEQHKGKTFFMKRILPPQLRDFTYCANPSAKVDKDFIISLSEFAIIILDEFSFSTNAKSDAYKFIVTSGRSNERDAYAHFRERRDRKAGLIAATNHRYFIKDVEGSRRYPGVDIVGTVNLLDNPLNYDGAYAQALYLLEHQYEYKPTREESELITLHNRDYMEPNDCEEALRTYFHVPTPKESHLSEFLTATQLLEVLRYHGCQGRGFNAVEIGKAAKRIGYKRKNYKNTSKYLVVKNNLEMLEKEGKNEAKEYLENLLPQAPLQTELTL